MTLRTITFDDSTHKLVPIIADESMLQKGEYYCESALLVWRDMTAAAPEYQDKIADLESQDFYEVMQAYRHEQLHVARRFEFVKQWLRNPVYEYQDTKKDE